MKPFDDHGGRIHPGFILSLIAIWLALGFDGRLHWDEPQYIYTGSALSVEEILADRFEPSGIDGFAVSRIAHVLFIKLLSGVFGVGIDLVIVAMACYVISLLMTFYVSYLIVRDLQVPAGQAGFATMIVGFSPVGLYLAYKTLPDVPALMWSSLAVLAAIRSVRGGGPVWIAVGALAIALAALTKYILVWTFAAFALAVLMPGHASMPRTRSIVIFLIMGAGSIIIFAAALIATGLPLSSFLAFLSAARSESDPFAAKAFHLVVGLAVFLIVIPLAAFHHDKRLVRFFLVWFGMATVPFLIIVPRLEVRYLAPALIPMVALTFLSLDFLSQKLSGALTRIPRVLLAGVVLFAVALSSRSVQSLTEHEVEMLAMRKLLQQLDQDYGSGAYAIVTPWEYSTFLYWRVMYPEREVYDAFDPGRLGRPEWIAVQQEFFGRHLLRDMDQLRAVSKPLIYVGFPEAMPIGNLRTWAQYAPSPLRQLLLGRLDALGGLKHLSLSWIWDAPELALAPVAQAGNYVAYRVALRETAGGRSLGRSPNPAHGGDEKSSRIRSNALG